MKIIPVLGSLLLFSLLTSNASAKMPAAPLSEDVYFFALLVGSNLPGKNQAPLFYAHHDMEKMGNVLSEIGKYDPRHISRLADPNAKSLHEALRRIKQQLENLPASAQSRFVFYYSGHAKSNALVLGEESLSLKELRSLLVDIPSSQKIIILDACQSGSFSRVKGVSVTKDFSHNSRAALQTRGTAVLASSSAEELSQESEAFEGSIFTHNLVTGLRGAADADTNGRVSLFEAYDYAYNNTLIASADTRIGKQHVTLETDLKGTGETVLTWPESSSAKLVLPAEIRGTVTIFDKKTKTIHAEINKAKGSDVTLAFPPGKYGAVVTKNNRALNCTVQLKPKAVHRLKENTCQITELKSGAAKAAGKKTTGLAVTPFFTIQGGVQFLANDKYINRLEALGYQNMGWGNNNSSAVFYWEAIMGINLNRYFSFGFLYSSLDRYEFGDNTYGAYSYSERQHKWFAQRFGAHIEVAYPILQQRLTPHVFVDVGIGATKSVFESKNMSGGTSSGIRGITERSTGMTFGGGGGVYFRLYKVLQLATQLKYIYAPILTNTFNEKQNSGGWIVSAGLHISR